MSSVSKSIPPFEITARVLFVSNKDFNAPRSFRKSIWESGVLPLKNRCACIGLPFAPLSAYEYVGWLASAGGMLKQVYFDWPLGEPCRRRPGGP